MHLLLVFMYYLRPEDPGIKRFNEFCRLWSEEHGMRITVLTGQLHYNTGRVYSDCAGKDLVRETDGAVELHRLSAPDTYGSSYKGRAWSQLGWARHARAYLGEIDTPDLVLGVSPPLWSAWPAVTASRRFKVPLVLELRDLWPEAIVRMGVAPAWHPAVLALGWLERWAYRNAAHLVNIFEGHRQNISERGLREEEDITVIPHGVLLDSYDNLPEGTRAEMRRELGISDDQKLVIYAGAHGVMYNLMNMVEVATALRDRPDIQFVSIGEGFEREMLTQEVADRGLANLRFLGPKPVSEVPRYLCAADIATSFVNSKVLTGWSKKTHGSFRNALFDYAAARLPVVFNEPGYTVDELQDRAKGGLFADCSENVEEMVHHITYLVDNPEKAREMAENNHREIAVRYNRRKMAQKYVELMEGVLQKR